MNDFLNILEDISQCCNHIVIGGDLNCNLLSKDFRAVYLRDIASRLLLRTVPSGPTHHTAVAESWIDVFIDDDLDLVQSYRKSLSPLFIAGHDFLELSISLDKELALSRLLRRRNYRGTDSSGFCNHLNCAVDSFLNVSGGIDINNFCSRLNDLLVGALNIFAPLKIFTTMRHPVPWLTNGLRVSIKRKNKLFNKVKRSRSLIDLANYRHFRNQLNSDIKYTRDSYFLNSLNNITYQAKLWRELACLGLAKSFFVSPLRHFSTDVLNSYYVSVTNSQPAYSCDDIIRALTSLSDPLEYPEFTFSDGS